MKLKLEQLEYQQQAIDSVIKTGFKDTLFICLERSLDTTMKWNLKHLLGDKLVAF